MPDPFTPNSLDETSTLDRDSQVEDWEFNLSSTDQTVSEKSERRPFIAAQVILFVVLSAFTLRLLQLQVSVGAKYRSLSEGNSIRTIIIPADRGLITDSKGKILARNDKKTSLFIRIEELPETLMEREELYQKIDAVLSFPDQYRQEIEGLRGKTIGDYLVSTRLEKEQHLLLRELSSKHSAIVLKEKAIREYALGDGLSHILGYVGQVTEEDLKSGYSSLDSVGKTGVEKIYENELKGTAGLRQLEVNSQGEPVHVIGSDYNQEPVAGSDLKLNLDATLQNQLATSLAKALEKRNQDFPGTEQLGGTIIALDPRDGAVRALVSLPAYDNSLFARGVSPDELKALYDDASKPTFNRAIAGIYPPGSTIKPLVATGALHYNLISAGYAIDTPSAIQIGQFTFPDWKDHGLTNIKTAIAESNNIFFYALGGGWENIPGLGLDRLRETLHWFGLEEKTGIDLPGESTGYLLSEERKREQLNEPVYLGDIYHLSIGQGDSAATPLQMATATAAIANNGSLYSPRLVDSIVDKDGNEIKKVTGVLKGKIPATESELKIVREGMRQAVESGSSRPLSGLRQPVAGKTGTAQFGPDKHTHAWFTGFGPYQNPEIVITILIEGGGGSFEAAVPLAEETFKYYFDANQ